MKVTYKYLPENLNRGHSVYDFVEKRDHSVWAPKNGIFSDVDSQKWDHLVCKNAIASQNLQVLC